MQNVLSIAGDIPVVAAGGIGDPEAAKRYMTLGASGVLCGSRFVASQESQAHDDYKRAIIEAGSNETVRSICFDLGWKNAPHRTIRNSTFRMWERAGFPTIGNRPGEGDIILNTKQGLELPRYAMMPPKQGMGGDPLAAALYAGSGIDRIDSILAARDIVKMFADALLFGSNGAKFAN
ncbi:MAG: nitronate monooxygenase [Arenicella sp.]|nr:nitronate monooxygenase [Arenicella sp.]